MKNVKYEVPGISCGHCVNSIQVELGKLDGIGSVWADQDTKTVEIEFEEPANEDRIKTLLESINYPVKE
jgi:copper chaperone CopZ